MKSIKSLFFITISLIVISGCVGNSAPTADAGPDQNVVTNTVVYLNASGSSDADGDDLTYQWTIISTPAGSTATLSDPTDIAPSFTADLDGTYVIELIVNDGTVDSSSDTVTIVASTTGGTLSATAIFDDQINLTWIDSFDNEYGFEIEMSKDGATGWRLFALEPANSVRRMATGLEQDTTYYFRVRPRMAAGYGPYSNVASAKTLTDTPVYGAFHVDPNNVTGEIASDSNNGILISEGGTGPWLTLEHAWFNAPSGSTIYMRDGVHVISNSLIINNVAQSGTFDAPTVMRNYPGESPVLDTTALNTGGDTGDGIVWDGPDYWVHRGFTHQYGNQGFLVGWDRASENNRWSRIVAIDNGTVGGDNKGYINAWNARAEGIILEDLDLTGPGPTAHGNTGALYLSRMHRYTIKRVIARNGRHTIHFKHAPSYVLAEGGKEFGALIQDAYFEGFTGGSFNGNYAVFDNIIYNDCGDLTFALSNGTSGGDFNTIRNITLHDTVLWLSDDNQDGNGLEGAQFNQLYDIVLSGTSRLQVEEAQGSGVDQNNQTDYIVYPQGQSIRYWFDGGDLTNTDLAGWRAVNPLPDQDMHSETGTVNYVGTQPYQAPEDFEIAPDSPVGFGTASHGGNMGANPETIFTL